MTNLGASTRFLDKKVPDEIIEKILCGAYLNLKEDLAYGVSCVVIDDELRKVRLSEAIGYGDITNQAPILMILLLDMKKIEKMAYQTQNSKLTNLLQASFGLGSILSNIKFFSEKNGLTASVFNFIGDTAQLNDILELPELTYPVIPICIGYSKGVVNKDKTPSVLFKAFMHKETYQKHVLNTVLSEYDEFIRGEGKNPMMHNDKKIIYDSLITLLSKYLGS